MAHKRRGSTSRRDGKPRTKDRKVYKARPPAFKARKRTLKGLAGGW